MSRDTKKNVEVFPPGVFIQEELEARGWTQRDLAKIIDRPVQAINEIVRGKKRLTAETARQIAAAFGTDAEVWMNLETAYQLYSSKAADPAIARRAAAMAGSA